MSDFETITYEKRDNIARITLNRPQVMNAYNTRMRDELYQVLGALKDDGEVKAAVFAGAGESFCAGADLSEFLTAPSPIIARQVRRERDVWGLLLSLPQPLIAALHGYVLGSGLEIALCCDMRIASAEAQFGLPEARLGIIPAAGATQTLPRTVGQARAMELLLTGRRISAGEALGMGLVNRVLSRSELLPTAEKLARQIAARPATAVRNAKEAVARGADLPLEQGLALERRLARARRGRYASP